LLTSVTVCAQSRYDFTATDQAMRDMVSQQQLSGGSVRNAQSGQVRFLQHYGNYNASTRTGIGSATKWLSALVLARLVERGELQWSDTVGEWMPQAPTDKHAITVEQLFSHTSGIVTNDTQTCLSDQSITLRECAEQILALPLQSTPGTAFAYGGNSMQVAGRIAEIASGKNWNQLFYDEVVVPLGMFDTDFATASTSPGYIWVNNARIAGGVRSTASDYGRVLDMVLANGKVNGQAYLQPSTLTYMRGDQIRSKQIISTPLPEAYGYGIGQWIEKVDANGSAYRISSPGAFGTTPWVDLYCGCNGIIFVKDQRSQLKDQLYLIEELSIQAMSFRRYIKPPQTKPVLLSTQQVKTSRAAQRLSSLDPDRTIR
jgi:CubicO group peptidase (beta-lactamase class C family)